MSKIRLSTQAAIIGAGRFLNMAVAAGTLMVLARLLPDKETYGAVCQLITLYMVFSQIFAVGLPQSTYYFLPRYSGGERRGFLMQTITLLMISGILLGLGLFFGANFLGGILDSQRYLPGLLRIFAIYPLFMLPTMAVEGTLLHAGRPATIVLFNTSIRIGMFCALVVPAFMIHGRSPLPEMMLAWMVSGAVMWIWALLLMLSTVRGLPLVWKREMLLHEWNFSLPLAGVTLLTISTNYLDRFLVSHRFGAAAFGIYANGAIDIPTVSMIVNATSAVLLAEFSRRTSRGEVEGLIPLWHSAIRRLAVLVFASLGFLAFWAHETMRLLFSARFAESGVIFSIYVWVIPLRLIGLQSLYVAMGVTRYLAALTAMNLILDATLVVLGGRYFGLPGMAIGALCAGYVSGIVGVYMFTHLITSIGWRRFLPWRDVLPVLALALISGGISRGVYLLAMRHWHLILAFAVALIVYLGSYVGGLAILKMHELFIPPALLRRLRRQPADSGVLIEEPDVTV